MRIVLHPEAQADITEAADWYEVRAPGLGVDFVNAVFAALEQVSLAPRMFAVWPHSPAVSPPVQRYLMRSFPAYAIAFRRFPDHLLVIAVAHSSRKPRFWAKRATP